MQPNNQKERLTVKVTAHSVYKRNLMIRVVIIILLILLLLLSITYGLAYITNETGNFTIELDPNLKAKSNMLISPTSDFKETPLILKTNSLVYMDNISERWLPANIDQIEGPHSKDNYLAYTFFVKNNGEKELSYMTEINILSVIKNVDEAVRVAVYKNGTKVVYAKRNKQSNEPEKNTVPFTSATQVMMEKQTGLKPKEVDRFTIVIWLEGDDPECLNDIMGGEMKMKMLITETQTKS